MYYMHDVFPFFPAVFNRAMASASGKEEFLKQFEAIVAGVKRNKAKVMKNFLWYN